MTTHVKLLVGTKKSGFVYTSDEKRQQWELSEPILPGWSIYNMAADPRANPPRFYMAANHWAWGPSVAKSTDGGKTWDYRSEGLDTDGLEPEGVYVGTSNGQLFASADGGDHWQRLPGDLPPVLSVACAAY